MNRFTSYSVLVGFTAPWFLAASPIRRCPSSVNATHDGVMRFPRSLEMISTAPFFHTPTHEYVVPKSIPICGVSEKQEKRDCDDRKRALEALATHHVGQRLRSATLFSLSSFSRVLTQH